MVLTSPEGSDEVTIKLLIEYDGSGYSGWQRQKNKPTVQQTIEEALQVLLQEKNVRITGAGRTDSGVHARSQAAHFSVSKDLFQKLDFDKLVYQLNSLLPGDITIRKAARAPEGFHARYSAKKRMYRYLISERKLSYNGEKYFIIRSGFEIVKARQFCKIIEGRHSFRALCKNKTDDHDFESNVYFARIKKVKDGTLEFEICANRFLHSMVRAIVGMMIQIAAGKTDLKEFKEKFKRGENIRIQYVPANALILEKIIY